MDLRKLIFTENDCYKVGTKMTPIGIVVHSTGANNPELRRYIGPDDGIIGKNLYNNHWNQFRPSGRQVCVHGFIGKDKNGKVRTYQTLPWNMRGWHAGSGKRGSANDGYIGFEICEDSTNNKAYAVETYSMAVELCAYLAKLCPTIKCENIIGHNEAAARGIASNHADPEHWWKKHGLSMAQFRKDVKAKAEAKPAPAPKPDPIEPKPEPVKGKEMRIIAKAGLNYRSGAGAKYKKLGAFNFGQVVTVTEEKYNWGYVPAVKGWASLQYLSAHTPKPQQPKLTRYQVTARAGLNYREAPSGKKLGAFNYGQTVAVTEEKNNWGYVPAVKGWISMQYVKKV